MQMKVTLVNKPNPEVCAIGAGLCYDAKDPWKALLHALENGHESVIEHTGFSFLIEGVSRALLAQLTRHRIASFSVQSQRYVTLAGGFPYVTPKRILELGEPYVKHYENQMAQIAAWYDGWLDLLGKEGAEDARFVLPNACETKLLMTMNARELRHFFSLRCCNRAQWEIRKMADAMLRVCKEEAYTLFADAGPGCVRGACPEGKKACGKPRNKEV
jgi:thymidylate synthase (FAD)